MSPEYAAALRSENNMLEDENLKLRKQLDEALGERDRARSTAVALEQECDQVDQEIESIRYAAKAIIKRCKKLQQVNDA